MRMLAAAGARGDLQLEVVAAGDETSELGAIALTPDWSIPLPGYEELELRFPMPTAVLELVEAVAPDVVHVATPGPVGACGLLAAKVLGIPVVGSWHTELGPYALHLTRDLLVAEAFERYVQWFYRQCDLVLAPTRRVQAELDARGFAARTRIWGRGVDTELFTPYRRDEALRHELLDGAETLLLSVGRISAEKGVAMLFDAYRELDPQRVRLVVVGDGPSRRELEASAPPGVCFRGELHGAELASAYASADVFCFPSQTDTFGQVVLEASASGLPVVAVNVGGAAELVHDRRTGLLAQRADAAAFRDALRELIADEPLRRRLGAAARAEALEHTWKRSYRQLLTAYGEATARSVATATAVLA
jgi:glycosyltransferase involved in cell wall biosynthesis